MDVPLTPDPPPVDKDLELQPPDKDASLLEGFIQGAFSDYKIIKEIARGGMGAVLLAEQIKLRRRVAMKVLLPGQDVDEKAARARFIREARTMARLKHPNIIDIYDVGEAHSLSYFTMELIEGNTLADLIRHERLNQQQAISIVRTIAEALAFAHAQGVIHRDLKPANIMLRANGEPVLMDFGLAKDFNAQSMQISVTGNIMGTPAYMSPEQAQGLRVDERSDICSLGIVFYEALTLKTPFEGNTVLNTLQNVLTLDPLPAHKVNPGVAEPLARVCGKAMQKDPRLRYGSMAEFIADLDNFEQGLPVQAQAPTIFMKTMRLARRNRTAAIAALSGAVVLLVVCLALFSGWLRLGKNVAVETRETVTTGTPESRALHVKTLASDLREGRLASGSDARKDALAALRLAAADADASVATVAIQSLADLKDRDAAAVLQAQLDPGRPAAVRREAVLALGALHKQGVQVLLVPTLRNDPALEVRLAVLDAMGDVPDPGTLITLLELSVRGDPPALAAAVRNKLAQVRSPSSVLALYTGRQTSEVGRAFAELAAKKSEYERQLEEAMAETLNAPTSPAAKPQHLEPYEIVVKKLSSAARDERLAAAYDLGVLADDRSEAGLRNALLDADQDVALAAAEALGRLKKIQEPQKIAELLRYASPAARLAAARACGVVQPAPDGAKLVEALNVEKQAGVQAELAQALGRLKYRSAASALQALLADGAPAVRLKAAHALGALGEKGACGALVDALARAGDDKELKEEIAGALSALTGKTIGPDAAQWRKALPAGQ